MRATPSEEPFPNAEQDPLPFIDGLEHARRAITLRRTNAVYLAVISIIVTIGFAGWGPRYLPNPWMPFAGAAVSGAMVIAALVATIILVVRERRAGREFHRTLESLDLAGSSRTPPPAGVTIGRQLVLVSDDETLHAAVEQAVPAQVARRTACLVLAIAVAAAFAGGLIAYGPKLHGLSSQGVSTKAMIIFWFSPVASFGLFVAALCTKPLQWYASASERSLTIEKLSLVGRRTVVTIPDDEIDSFELWMDDMYVVTTTGRRHSLLGFQDHKPIPGLPERVSKQAHAAQQQWKSARVASGIMRLLRGSPEHTLRVGVANRKDLAPEQRGDSPGV